MKKCIKTWHRLKPIKVLGNGVQTLFSVCTVLEVTIASILDTAVLKPQNVSKDSPMCAHTRTMFLVQLEVPAECSVLLVMTSLLSKKLNVIRTFLDCTQRVKKGSFT